MKHYLPLVVVAVVVGVVGVVVAVVVGGAAGVAGVVVGVVDVGFVVLAEFVNQFDYHLDLIDLVSEPFVLHKRSSVQL